MKTLGFSRFNKTLCISLRRNTDRRQHMQREFAKLGINFTYIDAYDWDCEEVKELMGSSFVAKHPPCFRCGKQKCHCKNKCLFPPQIGNWLSHMKAWQLIAEDINQLSLVCEDDVVFLDTCQESLNVLWSSSEVNKSIDAGEPLLLRLGWALCDDHTYTGNPYYNSEVKMSNPCYAINSSMATLLLRSLKKIDTTSDVFLHRIIGSKVRGYTVFPPLAHDLSWSTGEFSSEIRPTENHIKALRQKLELFTPTDSGYAQLVLEIKREEERISNYKKFNDRPHPDRWR